MIPYVQIRTFLETMRSGSVTRAAKSLGLSQPAASAHIQTLESLLDSPLFVRHARGVEPTRVARDLERQLGPDMDRVEAEFHGFQARAKAESGPIHIVGPGEFVRAKMPDLLARLSRQGFRPRMELGGQDMIYDRLLSGQAELAITASDPMSDQIGHKTIFTETLMPVATPKWIRQTGAQTLRSALHHSLLAYDFDLPLVRAVISAEVEASQTLSPHIIVPDLDTLRHLTMSGEGWSVLPNYLVDTDLAAGQLQLLDTRKELRTNNINLAWLKSSLRHPRIAQAKASIEAYFAGLAE